MKIVWSEPSLSDFKNIRDYIAKDSPYYASIFIEKVIAAVKNSLIFPFADVLSRSATTNTYGKYYTNITE